jgi:hypothetical protein
MGQTLSEEDEEVEEEIADDEEVIGLEEEDQPANEADKYMVRGDAAHITGKVQNAAGD